jgi:hypothetical protein
MQLVLTFLFHFYVFTRCALAARLAIKCDGIGWIYQIELYKLRREGKVEINREVATAAADRPIDARLFQKNNQ